MHKTFLVLGVRSVDIHEDIVPVGTSSAEHILFFDMRKNDFVVKERDEPFHLKIGTGHRVNCCVNSITITITITIYNSITIRVNCKLSCVNYFKFNFL